MRLYAWPRRLLRGNLMAQTLTTDSTDGLRLMVAEPPADVLLNHDRELERIAGCLGQARQGHGGALVLEGPAGIGKTVLLAAGRDAARAEGFRVLRARGAELERGFAFGLVRQLIEPMVASASGQERAVLLDGPPGVAAGL